MNRMRPLAFTLMAAGLIGAGSAGAWSLSELWHDATRNGTAPSTTVAAADPAATTAPATRTTEPPAPAAWRTAPDYRAIVKARGPSVVGVSVQGLRQTGADEGSDEEGPSALPPFLRGFPGMPQAPQGRVPFRGFGSGFIVASDGVVLTNAHVVDGAKEVRVKLSDRREFRAKVLGSDKVTDVAVLKLDGARDLPVVALGDPKQIEVGDPVLAIGAPFGFEQTATQGIVSAKGRSLPGDSFVPFIQTDAAVNPGNSGGPLFDGQGRVVGINAQIYSRSGGFEGLAFAIPIDVALRVKDQIVAHGRVDHARMGVNVQDLSQGLAESFGLNRPDGALVASVVPGSAAAEAKLKPGDVILKIDDQPVQTAGDVSARVGAATPGDALKLSVWRDKSAREIEVKLGKVGRDQARADNPSADEAGSLGLAVRPLSPQEQRQLRTDHGLVVEDVSGPAAQAGLQAGDVVLALNGQPVQDAEQIRKTLEKKPRSVALLVQRNQQQIFIPVPLG